MTNEKGLFEAVDRSGKRITRLYCNGWESTREAFCLVVVCAK